MISQIFEPLKKLLRFWEDRAKLPYILIHFDSLLYTMQVSIIYFNWLFYN